MRAPPSLADFTHTRACKLFCEKYLTLPLRIRESAICKASISSVISQRAISNASANRNGDLCVHRSPKTDAVLFIAVIL